MRASHSDPQLNENASKALTGLLEAYVMVDSLWKGLRNKIKERMPLDVKFVEELSRGFYLKPLAKIPAWIFIRQCCSSEAARFGIGSLSERKVNIR
jgi:hypothetical protein